MCDYAGNRAGKRNRVIHAHDESEHISKRILRDRSVKSTDGSSATVAKLARKRKLEQQVTDAKKRKPGRPPGRPPVLLSPGVSAKGPLPAGWSVSLKDSRKEPGKQHKQYKVGCLGYGATLWIPVWGCHAMSCLYAKHHLWV